VNPINVLYAAVAVGLLSPVPWVRYGRRVARETALAVPDPLVGEWAEVVATDGEELTRRRRYRDDRADTWRGMYVASLEVADEGHGETPA
jgi:hypothetical protein